jgi:PBP1b-binding outer membrane lipoprotein LpoB
VKRAIIVAAALLLTGCASTTPVADQGSATPTPTVTSTPTPASAEQMEQADRIMGEALFLSAVKDDIDVTMYSDDELIFAADAVCMGIDRGDDMEALFTTVAALLPNLRSLEDVAKFGGTASGTICTLP